MEIPLKNKFLDGNLGLKHMTHFVVNFNNIKWKFKPNHVKKGLY